ncbi:Cof-type HAD-IIB family hydrolase [Mesoplasma lactucae]|nr:Cof-type HAD-IIB family hydrolase [Mesoplasma lactucae]ATZ19937.1 HAD superfamily hydrolase [Mesoplasma lactucae ATCC 49193]MCL8217112.1 5-amino-6-(5-phospho-D-ribitylamino)uracil phosphatase YitU [Mesoplasma lactucae ATCC 49193]
MKKMLVFDIDGTLVHHQKMSKEVVSTLLEAKKQGNIVTLATGRGSRGILKVAKELELNDGKTPVIGLNGADVFYFNPDWTIKQLWKKPIPKDKAIPLYEAAMRNHISFVAYTDDPDYTYVTRKFNYLSIFMHGRTRAKTIKVKKDCSNLTYQTMKVICHGTYKNYQKFEQEIKPLNLAIFGWSYVQKPKHNLEINMTGINKAVGIAHAAKLFNVEQTDVIYFGDGSNDIDALEWAGTGVAMGQAPNEIKAHANQVTQSVKEDGVAVWVKNNVLK